VTTVGEHSDVPSGRRVGAADESFTVRFVLNGERREAVVPARWTLADVLREKLGATGTHLGCEQGVCGACTVLVDDEPVRSCLFLAVQADGRRVRTVEGLAPDGSCSNLQRSFMEHHALQCGFCTPGFLVLATAILEDDPNVDDETLKESLSSNLCRCTGYRPIVDAVAAVRGSERA
jgi:aerobic carbon-monoxide dehydrogenase small subunit